MAGPQLPVPTGIYAGAVRNIPEKWDHVWFRRFVTDFVQKADTRNAVAGVGVAITSPTGAQPSGKYPAVISANMGTMPIFTATKPGIVPASGGGTTNFLRADGTWAVVLTSPVVWTLTDTDRLAAVNAGSGQTGQRVILAGANAGQFTQISDIIALGNIAFSGGTAGTPIVNANLSGLIVIGSQAAPAVTATVNLGFGQGTSTIIGYKALNVAPTVTYSTIVGSQVFANWLDITGASIGGNVCVGERIGVNLTGAQNFLQQNVILGFEACATVTSQKKDLVDNVILGYRALNGFVGLGTLGGPGIARNVLIGSQVAQLLGNNNTSSGVNDNVFIGFGANDIQTAKANVYIGSGVTSGGAVATNNIGIGSTNTGGSGVQVGTDRNIVIGADSVNAVTNNTCILIGAGCGKNSAIAATDNQFLMETYNGTTRRAFLYGLMAAASPGGLVVGHSTQGTNRDIPGFNILKVLNGSVTGVAPVGGGFFYSVAGNLHWVDTNNVDTQLTPPNIGGAARVLGLPGDDGINGEDGMILAAASSLGGAAALVVNAQATTGAQTATFAATNKPGVATTSPDTWVPITIDGTVHWIPAFL